MNEADRLMRNVDAIRYGTGAQAIGFYLDDLRAERRKVAAEIEGRLTMDGKPLAGVEEWILEVVREAAPQHNHPGGPYMCAFDGCPLNFASRAATAQAKTIAGM